MNADNSSRRFDRVPYKGSVALWKDREPYIMQVRDLGAGGVFLSSETLLDEGSLHTLRVALPGEPGFTVLGRVVRHRAGRGLLRGPGVALEFLDIAPRDQARLARYVERVHGPRAAAG